MLFDLVQGYDEEKKAYLRWLWEQIIIFLAKEYDPKKIISFLSKCGVVSIDDKEKIVYIGVPNEFVLTQVKKFFHKGLNQAVEQCYNPHFKHKLAIYQVFQQSSNDLQVQCAKLLEVKESAKRIDNPLTPDTKQKLTDFFGILFEKNYTFDTFVVGESNKFAFSAAKAVAEKPWLVYNPLFLYGSVGLGKTHLMQAIGNFILTHHRDTVVAYLPATKLIDEIVYAIQKNKLSAFIKKLSEVDVLMIDDVQFLGDKEKTQEIFHNIFNEFVSQKKQIILTSDRPPKELNAIEARLKSRFSQGLVCDVKTPDFETRLAILKEKLQLKDEGFSGPHLEIIAKFVKENVRELEGALNLFLTQKKLLGKDLSEQDIYDGLKTLGFKISQDLKQLLEYDTMNTRSTKNFASIVEMVAQYYNIAIIDIKGDSRKKEHSQSRQLLMYLAKKHFNRTLEKIGDYFGGKDHATVIYAINKFDKLLKTNPKLQQDLAVFTGALEQ